MGKEEIKRLVDEALEELRLIAFRKKDLRAYNKKGRLLKSAEKFAVEKIKPSGYLYEPLTDEHIILIIQPKR